MQRIEAVHNRGEKMVDATTQTQEVFIQSFKPEDDGDIAKLGEVDDNWKDNSTEESLKVGDVVRLTESVSALNADTLLKKDLCGRLRLDGEDGRKMVYFPDAPGYHHGEHWVRKSSLVALKAENRTNPTGIANSGPTMSTTMT